MARMYTQPGLYMQFAPPVQPLLVESVYSVVIVAICLLIYWKTREIEKLAAHKGITYFRLTFLHFALSYFFKFLTSFQVFAFGFQRSRLILQVLPMAGTMFVSFYASLMASIYLVNSMTWNKDEKVSSHEEAFWSIISIVAAALTVFMSQPWLYILSQVFLFAYAAYVLATSEKKAPFIKAVYPALLGFWVLTIVDIFIPDMLFVQIPIYLVSAGLFSVILYKVLKRVGK